MAFFDVDPQRDRYTEESRTLVSLAGQSLHGLRDYTHVTYALCKQKPKFSLRLSRKSLLIPLYNYYQ